MYNPSDNVKLELILKYINDIEIIISNHDNLEDAVNSKEGEYALMMCITQIGEAVTKIQNQNILDKIFSKEIVGMRNRIVHGYEDFDRKIVLFTLKENIPELKSVIEKFIKDF